MVTFVINYSREKIEEGLTKLFLYPYINENNFKIINVSSFSFFPEQNIVNEIKYFIYNNKAIKEESKKFQIIFVFPIYDEKKEYFAGNLANNFVFIKKSIIDKLALENLIPDYLSYIILDNLKRDFRGDIYDINTRIAEELSINGYVSTLILSRQDISNISAKYTDIINNNLMEKEDILWEIKNFLTDIKKDKKDLIKSTDIGQILDASLHMNTSKVDDILTSFERNLEYEFSKKKIEDLKKLDIDSILKNLLKREHCYCDFLFSVEDLESLDKVHKEADLILRKENQSSLSGNFIEKLNIYVSKLENIFKEICDYKKEALKNLVPKNNDNLYVSLSTLDIIFKEFKTKYINKYLKTILESKSINNDCIATPSSFLTPILSNFYSLNACDNIKEFNIYRLAFSEEKLIYNYSKLQFVYFLTFLIEYGNNTNTYLGKGQQINLDKINFKKRYIEALVSKYISTLEKEKNSLTLEQDKIKNGGEIAYYEAIPGDNSSKIQPPSIVEIKVDFFENKKDFKEIKDWISDIDSELKNYIDNYNNELSFYQIDKNRFAMRDKKIVRYEKDIKDEIATREMDRDNKRKILIEKEKDVEIDIKNNLAENLKDIIYTNNLKSLLDRRANKKQIVIIGILTFLVALFSLRYPIKNLLSSTVLVLAITISSVLIFYSVCLSYFKKRIKPILYDLKFESADYLNKIEKKLNTKKEYIDLQADFRIAEKNYIIAKNIQKKIDKDVQLLSAYIDILNNHCDLAKMVLNTLKNIGYEDTDYKNESFIIKSSKTDFQKAPFENNIFLLKEYVNIEEYKKFSVNLNQQKNEFIPQYIVGCENIILKIDEIYKKVRT